MEGNTMSNNPNANNPATYARPACRVYARVTDLMWDGMGWSENGASVTTHTFDFPRGTSDLTIARRIRKHFGMGKHWKRDSWCDASFVWRSGCMGCYADIEHTFD
jgi:hypothetical protein